MIDNKYLKGKFVKKVRNSLFITMATLLVTPVSGLGAERNFLTAKEVMNKLKETPLQADPALPNVLLLGDSISLGYTLEVRELLKGKANVFRPIINCGPSSGWTRKALSRWVGDRKYDVIHFNAGLHDINHRDSDGRQDKQNGAAQVSPEQYRKNLEFIVTELKQAGDRLIWASTTVVPEDEPSRFTGDEIKYNGIAAEVMAREGIAINNLHEVTRGFEPNFFKKPGDVHYTLAANVVLGRKVADSITASLNKEGVQKPNILWIVTEDIGCDMACYGTKGVHTPHMDRLAAEGALYTRAYTTASVCSPSRSSFMTGLYPHQVFSKNMRIYKPLKKQPLPEGVDIFTKHLRDAGYAIGFPGHQKTDWGFVTPKTNPYDIKDWDQLTQQQPFFCQYQFYDTHRVNKKRADGKMYPFLACPEHPVDRGAIELHPYTPDTPEAREELGAYLENLNLLDMHIGKLIDDLKAKGLYEKTIIVVMGDNGPPIFRGKGFLYERGILMPLIVRVPKGFEAGFEPGARIDELVSALDMAPTFINWAGGQIPEYMEGRIFFGPDKQPEPEYLFAMRDRHGMNVDRVRSVCSKDFKYMRNYVRGMTCFENSLNNVAASNAGEKLFKQGRLSGAQAAYYEEKPEEELYNLKADPFELNNLAKDPAYQKTLSKFRTVLDNWIERTDDDGEFEDPAMLAEMDRLFEEAKRARQKK